MPLPTGESAERTFDGSPQLFLPVLKQLMRFPRPFITWSIFEEEAPSTFPTEPTEGADEVHAEVNTEEHGPEKARDPRDVNNVTHMERTHAAWKRDQQQMANEEWTEEVPCRMEASELKDGRLYMVRLEKPDGELYLGLVQVSPERLEPARPSMFELDSLSPIGRLKFV